MNPEYPVSAVAETFDRSLNNYSMITTMNCGWQNTTSTRKALFVEYLLRKNNSFLAYLARQGKLDSSFLVSARNPLKKRLLPCCLYLTSY